MELQFKDLDSDALKTLAPHFTFRENKTCDSVFLGLFLWKDYYQVRYAIGAENNIFLRITADGKEYAALPICQAADLPHSFDAVSYTQLHSIARLSKICNPVSVRFYIHS